MADYPTLTRVPSYPLGESTQDNAIKSNMENGIVIARKKFTLVRQKFQVRYAALDATDKAALVSFFTTVGTFDSFNWTHPVTDVVHVVRFKTPITYMETSYDRHDVRFELEEV